MALIQVPGKDEWVLRGDTALTKAALEVTGTINWGLGIEHDPLFLAIKPGDVFIDVGAFIGDTSRAAEKLGAEVWAFEPYPDAFEALLKNCPRAHCFNAPVGDGRPMMATGQYGENNGNMGTRMVTFDGPPSLRIDDLRIPRVSLVKIDCEGCEPAALDGMAQTLKLHRPPILIEVYDTMLKKQGFVREDVLRRLRDLGYRLEVSVGREEDDRLDYRAIPVTA